MPLKAKVLASNDMKRGDYVLVEVKIGDKMIKMQAKHARFCDEYLIDLNGKQSAIRAGYAPNSAEVTASKLLTNTKVRAYIDYQTALIHRRLGVSAERIVNELAKIAFVDPTELLNIDSGTMHGNATKSDKAVIQSVKVKTIPTENGDIVEREIRLYDKVKALELLGKREAMWVEKREDKIDQEITVVLDDQSAEWAK